MNYKSAVLCCSVAMFVCPALQAKDFTDQVEHLNSTIWPSAYGKISRLQAVLALTCDQPGLAKALNDARAREFLKLNEENKINWKDGDTPELVQALSTAMSVSYSQGISLALKTNQTDQGKKLICQTVAEQAQDVLNSSLEESQ